MDEKLFKSCLFIINRKCNMECPFCNVIKIKTEDAPFEDVMASLEIMWKLSNFIIIMGGESLIYDGIFKVFSRLDELGADFTIVTNGTLLTDEMIKKLKKAGLKNITVSIDYYKGFNTDKIKELKKDFDDVSVSLVYDSNMVGKLYDIVKDLSDSNIWSIISMYNYSTDDRTHYLMSEEDTNITIKESQKDLMIGDVYRILSDFDNLLIHNSKDYIENFPKYYRNQNWHCSYPHRLVVNNDLKVMVCEDMAPFDDIDIFMFESMIHTPEFFSNYKTDFEKQIKLCKGCYISCYYDLERLTPLEISHKGGKNVSFGITGLSLCVRSKDRTIKIEETHICWFCGEDIKIKDSSKAHCKKCGLKKCTYCGKCFCDGTDIEKEFLLWINRKYCCNRKKLERFTGFIMIPDIFIDNISPDMFIHAAECILNCSKIIRGEGNNK